MIANKTGAGQKQMGEFTRMEKANKKAVGLAQKCLHFIATNLLLLLLIGSIIAGIVLGIALRSVIAHDNYRALLYIEFLGELLMRMLKMLILPLVVSSLICGLAGLDAKTSGKIGARAMVYFLGTTFIAVILGMILVTTIRPGLHGKSDGHLAHMMVGKSDNAYAFLDLIRNMFPNNLVEATFKSTATINVPVKYPNGSHVMDGNSSLTRPKVILTGGSDYLGLIVYSMTLGLVTSRMGESGLPVIQFFDAMTVATMKMVGIVIWFSPLGIMCLIAYEVVAMAHPAEVLTQLSFYILTVVLGQVIHGFLILPLIYFIVCRRNPFKYMKGVLPAMTTAFGTASSSATLPVTYRCLEEVNQIDPRVTRFVCSVGATINMNGTALYEAVSAIFIAQLSRIELSAPQIITISITATCASIGAASVPQAGLVTMVIVLTATGLPTTDISKVLAVDWFVDRFRTMINVFGDTIGAGVVDFLSKEELVAMDEAEGIEQLQQDSTIRQISSAFDDDEARVKQLQILS